MARLGQTLGGSEHVGIDVESGAHARIASDAVASDDVSFVFTRPFRGKDNGKPLLITSGDADQRF